MARLSNPSHLFYFSSQHPPLPQTTAGATSSIWTSQPCQFPSSRHIDGTHRHCHLFHHQRDGVSPIHLYTFNHVMNGFSMVLSLSQLEQLEKMPGLWLAAGFGDDMIIGIIDTGVWLERESFNDEGMPPMPARWPTRVVDGCCCSLVSCADHFGYAKGTTIGMAPKARLAMYKVYFYNDPISACASDTLAGMDQAISNGVDLMSLSLGFTKTPFYENQIALGAFAATAKT
ncbi:hypothetical protein Acr_28g0002890 [Actinidia rufa]|uniref:Inhibitor I9 domain-containing protein n=1 Tax=Actinidia rufa TaxID=165716 RepID=A0A7J0HA28_9ERIC|nr:hypothetical protein Acr_28g0002890 [Actinidia rufa]